MICPNCKNEITPGTTFCRHCGTRMNVIKRCKKCGSPLDNLSGYCPRCGYDNSKKSNNNMLAAIIALLAVLIVVVIASTALLLTLKSDSEPADSQPASSSDISSLPKENDNASADSSTDEIEKNNSKKSEKSDNTQAAAPKSENSEKTEKPSAEKNTEKKESGKKQPSRYNEFLERAAAIERYDNSLDYDSMPQVEINTSTYEVFKRWDALLNDVYQYLKSTMSASDFESLKKDEQNWVAEKENAIETATADWRGGSGEAMISNTTAIQYTKDRCYYLISLTK